MFDGIFENQAKKQYWIDDEGMLWLNASSVCKQIGLANVSQSVMMYAEEDERQKIDVGALHPAWFVSEPGAWGLILAVKTEESKRFRQRLKTDILPSIRKNGYYVRPDATKAQLDALQRDILHHVNWSIDDFLRALEEGQADRRLSWDDF